MITHWQSSCDWTKIAARRVEPSEQIPHGIKYSLTLHNRQGERVIGFDNAHRVKSKKNYRANKITWDHKHKPGRVEEYEFESAGKLMEDFWLAVDQFME